MPIHPDPSSLIPAVTNAIEGIRSKRRDQLQQQPHPQGKRFSQEELSAVAYPSYKNLLQGRTRRLPDRASLLRIADYLECSADERSLLLTAAQYAPDLPAVQHRKQVTLLYADLAMSQALAADADVEDIAALLRTLWEDLERIIVMGGGRVVRKINARLLAVWSAMETREEDPLRAVRAALRMRTSVAETMAARQLELQLRIGVHTGKALLGTSAPDSDFDVVGPGVTTAMQLYESVSEGVVISHATFDHVKARVLVEPLATRRRPFAERSYRVLDDSPRTLRVPGISRAQLTMPLVGRDDALARLNGALTEVINEGALRGILVSGEAGIGKSRLVYEFAEGVRDRFPDLPVLMGSAGPSSGGMANILFCELFVYHLRLMDDDGAETVRAKFEAAFVALLGESSEARQAGRTLGQFLGYVAPEGDSNQSPADQRALYDRGLKALRTYLRHLSDQTPLVLVLENLHWSESSSLDVLRWLMHALADQPILVLGTARPAFDEQRPNSFIGQQLTLEQLPDAALRALLDHLLYRALPLPEPFVLAALGRADGNPLFLEEMVKLLIEEWGLDARQGRWALASTALPESVPPTLTSLLQARFDMLPLEHQRILQVAAVVGRTFWDDALIAILRESTTEASARHAVEQAIQAFAERDIVRPQPDSVFRSVRELRFKHVLMRDAVYDTLLKRDRLTYHAAAARWLERAIAAGAFSREYAALVAEHYARAERHADAVHWYEQAGQYAAGRFAQAVAIDNYTRALAVGADHEDLRPLLIGVRLARAAAALEQGDAEAWTADLAAVEAALSDADPPDLRARFLLSRAQAAVRMASAEHAREQASTAFDYASAHGLTELALEARFILAKLYARAGNVVFARDLSVSAWQLARRSGAEAQANLALEMAADYYVALGAYDDAVRCAGQALKAARRRRDLRLQALAQRDLGRAALARGSLSEAEQLATAALETQTAAGLTDASAGTHLLLGELRARQFDYAAALAHFEQARSLAQQTGDQALSIAAQTQAALTRIALAQWDGVFETLQAARDSAATLENVPLTIEAQLALASARWSAGQFASAASLADQAADSAERCHLPALRAFALLTRGNAALELGRLDAAADAFAPLLESAFARTLPAWECCALVKLAQVALRQGDSDGLNRTGERLRRLLPQARASGFIAWLDFCWSAAEVLEALGDARARDYAAEVAARLRLMAHGEADLERLAAQHALYRKILAAPERLNFRTG